MKCPICDEEFDSSIHLMNKRHTKQQIASALWRELFTEEWHNNLKPITKEETILKS